MLIGGLQSDPPMLMTSGPHSHFDVGFDTTPDIMFGRNASCTPVARAGKDGRPVLKSVGIVLDSVLAALEQVHVRAREFGRVAWTRFAGDADRSADRHARPRCIPHRFCDPTLPCATDQPTRRACLDSLPSMDVALFAASSHRVLWGPIFWGPNHVLRIPAGPTTSPRSSIWTCGGPSRPGTSHLMIESGWLF